MAWLFGLRFAPHRQVEPVGRDVIVALVVLAILFTPAIVEILVAAPPTPAVLTHVSGRLDALSIDSSGRARLVVAGRRIHAEPDVPWEFPGQQLVLREVLAQAPAACVSRQETGLLAADECLASRRANLPDRNLVVTVFTAGISEPVASAIKVTGGRDSVSGAVTFVSPSEGYLRVGGAYGVDTGTMLRINDPGSIQSMQSGTGCGREGNCSPDARFGIRRTPPSVAFTTGRPACIQGPVEQLCPPASREMPDGLTAAVQKGDHVSAAGAYEQIGDERVFFAEAMHVKSARVQ
jgi:hypothetical protein